MTPGRHPPDLRGRHGPITTRDGIEIFYKDWGSGQPIVFHHGWPLSADDWDAQMLYLTLELGDFQVRHVCFRPSLCRTRKQPNVTFALRQGFFWHVPRFGRVRSDPLVAHLRKHATDEQRPPTGRNRKPARLSGL